MATEQPSEYIAWNAERRSAGGPDPWDAESMDFERRDNWLIGYIDILTLFLTMLAMLLALTPNDGASLNERAAEVAEPPHLFLPEAGSLRRLESEFAYPFPDLWPGVFRLFEEPGRQVDLSLLSGDGASTDYEAPPKKAPAERAQPDGVQSSASASQRVAAPEDQLMKSLEATGLSERLRARKVARSVHLQVNDDILFAPGSADLTSKGQRLLDELAIAFGGHKCTIAIAGHTDNRPIANTRYPSNWELSAGRATAVARYLIERGYDPARLRATGYADTRPLAANDTPEGRARNRRVSLIVQFPETPETAESVLTGESAPVGDQTD